MKYFRKHNLLGQQEHTEIDVFPECLKGKESMWGRLVRFQIMYTQHVECRQEFDSFLRRRGPRVLWIPQCLLQKDLSRQMLGPLNLFLLLVYQIPDLQMYG